MKFNIFNLKKRRKRRIFYFIKPIEYDMVFMPANLAARKIYKEDVMCYM